MDALRTGQDPWGRQILVGIGWDLLPIVVAAAVAAISVHALVLALRNRPCEVLPLGDAVRLVRHSLGARAFHWLQATAVIVLAITGVLPALGWRFDWLAVHWWGGLALTVLVLAHIGAALASRERAAMGLRARELVTSAGGDTPSGGKRIGKYSVAQKLMHCAVTLLTAVAMTTGILMLVRLDTPWWRADPYRFGEALVGAVFVAHGAAAIALLGLVCIHVYFALRPEKRFLTRSMIVGWITRAEYEANHDPRSWSP